MPKFCIFLSESSASRKIFIENRPPLYYTDYSVPSPAGSAVSEGGLILTKKSDLKRKRRFGDRYDGYKVRAVDPFFVLIPHIMPTRNDSMVFFEEEIEITALEQFVRRMRRESDMKDLSMIQVVMAASVRMISQKPAVNRFVSGRKIYARNDITVSLSVKKEMSIEGEETTIKPQFQPEDTLHDVWERLHDEFTTNKGSDSSNNTDIIAKIVSCLPGFLIKFVVWFLNGLDQFGWLPKFIHEFSPFHTSVFVVDNGSLGIDSVFHHIYNFGTCSIFISVGRKRTEYRLKEDGSTEKVKLMTFRFVVDERICDGYYYGTTIRSFRKLMRNPEMLLTPPEQVFEDPGLPPAKGDKKERKAQKKLVKSEEKRAKKEAKAQKKTAA